MHKLYVFALLLNLSLYDTTQRSILAHICLVSFLLATSTDPDQTLQNVASDQGLHYLLTERSIKI